MACIDFELGLFAKHDSDSKTDGLTQIKSAQAKFAHGSCRAANPPYMPVDCASGASCGRDSPANARSLNAGPEAKQRQ